MSKQLKERTKPMLTGHGWGPEPRVRGSRSVGWPPSTVRQRGEGQGRFLGQVRSYGEDSRAGGESVGATEDVWVV